MRSALVVFAAGVALSVSSALAQPPTASVSLYGNGCGDLSGTYAAPAMAVVGLPQPGAIMTIRYVGVNGWPSVQPILITGLGSTNMPIPQLTPPMATNCTLLVNPDIAVIPMPLAQPPIAQLFESEFLYLIPNTPTVLGATVFHQWVTSVWAGIVPSSHYLMFSDAAQITAGV